MNAYPPPESVPGKNRAVVGSKSRMIFIESGYILMNRIYRLISPGKPILFVTRRDITHFGFAQYRTCLFASTTAFVTPRNPRWVSRIRSILARRDPTEAAQARRTGCGAARSRCPTLLTWRHGPAANGGVPETTADVQAHSYRATRFARSERPREYDAPPDH